MREIERREPPEPELLESEADKLNFLMLSERMFYPDRHHPDSQAQRLAKRRLHSDEKSGVKFFALKDGGAIVAGGSLRIQDRSGLRIALLTDNFTIPELRGEAYSNKITTERLRWAAEQGCYAAEANVRTDNPTALAAKLKNGFNVTSLPPSLRQGSTRSFKIYKNLRLPATTDLTSSETAYQPEWEEIPLSDLDTIRHRLRSGWLGIDVKNAGKKESSDPQDWVLILEKNAPTLH
ncbi:MAG: GNAT family N-acetyltransferase [Candidatus Magasanikbacteria bacterium]|nr:GNAT family N-acetyltransferase [Candidatus Magasanikbacteria bacterium]